MSQRSGYLMNASSNNENWNADCDYAIWTVDAKTWPYLLKLTSKFKEVARRTPGLHRWFVYSSDVTFISRRAAERLFGEEEVEALQSGDPPVNVTWDDTLLDGFDQTVSDSLLIGKDGFWWEAQPKHADNLTVGTDFVSLPWFARTCRFCGHDKEQHAAKKCLFGSTSFAPIVSDTRGKAKNRRARSHHR